MGNEQQIRRQWWSYSKLSNDRALRSTCLGHPHRYGSWEMQSNTSIFWRCSLSVPAPPQKKTSPVSSSPKLIGIQRCRRLWGSFGLASYFTLNAIYWIMNLLCSSDRVNSVNSLSILPPPKEEEEKNRPLRSLSDPGWNSNEMFSNVKEKRTGSQTPPCCSLNILVKSRDESVSLQGGWGGCAVLCGCTGMCGHAT